MNVKPRQFLSYGLEDEPGLRDSVLTAFAHLFAIAASILTAPLLLAGVIGLDSDATRYVINASLVVSGIATFIQVRRFGSLGSGLLSVQGTSFAFIGPMAYAASVAPPGTGVDQLIGTLMGCSSVWSAIVIAASFFLDQLKKVFTPEVTGTTIFLLGVSLLFSAGNNILYTISDREGARLAYTFIELGISVGTIIFLSTRARPLARLLSLSLGLAAGFFVAFLLGDLTVNPSEEIGMFFLLAPFRFSLDFDLLILFLLLPIFLVSLTETIGDITATSSVSAQPIEGPVYMDRLRGGVMADGVNTMLAAFLGAFPNTTFSQNNAVIAITGVASRRIGLVLAILLVLVGSIPLVSFLFTMIPGGVLHGATGFLFALIAYTGWTISRDRAKAGVRTLIIASTCSLGLMTVPGFFGSLEINIPTYLSILLGFPVSTGTFIAIVLQISSLLASRNSEEFRN